MHPTIAEALLRERHAELRRALQPAAARPPRARARVTPRRRIGWLLVELGLRLTLDSD